MFLNKKIEILTLKNEHYFTICIISIAYLHMENPNFNLVELSSKITKLFKLYDHRCTPPEWILDPSNLAKIRECMLDTVVYYDSSDNYSTLLDNVKLLVSHREPVNIACNQYYNKQGMMDTYGYDESLYGSLRESVNIAAFTRTLVKPAKFPNYSVVILN